MGIHLDLMDSINASATFNVLNEVLCTLPSFKQRHDQPCRSNLRVFLLTRITCLFVFSCALFVQEGRVVLAALLPLGRLEDEVKPNKEEEEDILKDMPRPKIQYPEP